VSIALLDGAGRGTGVTTDAALHARRAQNFHPDFLLQEQSSKQDSGIRNQEPVTCILNPEA